LNGWHYRVLAILDASRKTSETKALFVAALWAGAARLLPSIPTTIPVDLSAVGMGVLTASPAMMVAYALARLIIKAFTDGETPFMPSPKFKTEVP
jgi:hypothetical protein